MLHHFWKPWFVHRPTQIARRAWVGMFPPAKGYRPVRTAWGASLRADASRTIGRGIVRTGLFDFSVSELLARLVQPGATVYDVGANIGHMALLSSIAAGPGGRVHAFEPHPELARYLRQNIEANQGALGGAPIEIHPCALGSQPGRAQLYLSEQFEVNDGAASLVGSGASIEVQVTTLDQCLGEQARVDVMKVDVEGFEFEVFRGAAAALSAQRIAHIVFEDHAYADSAVFRQLQGFGYRIFSVGWTVSNLRIAPVGAGLASAPLQSPNFVATVAPEALWACARMKGWRVLRPHLGQASPVPRTM